MRYSYDASFMDYAARSSRYSATRIVALLRNALPVDSVLDVGCATGVWLDVWRNGGVADIHGVDGDYVDRQMLEIPAESFTPVNLNAAFDLRRQFDLVQSLEVAEHLEETASEVFADSIAHHARRYVLFSAAPPGQGGEYHINEQPYEFWRKKLEQRGFVALDAVRPAIAKDTRISYWYRYNMILFVRRETLPDVASKLRDKAVSEDRQIEDVSPITFRLRKAIVRRLPNALQHQIARLKAKFLPTGRI